MTSWEDVINQVVIPGEPQAIFAAQTQWSQTLTSVTSAKSTLDQGVTGLAAWHGDAGDVYRKRISDLAKALDGVIEGITPIPGLLGSAGTQMNTALNTIPIPGEMAQEVAKARSDFALTWKLQGFSNGTIDSIMTSWVNSRWNLAAMTEANLPMVNKFMAGVRDWFSSNDDIATKAYDNLNTGYTDVSSHMPQPSATGLGAASLSPMPTTPGPDFGGGGAGVPKLGSGSLPPGTNGHIPTGNVHPVSGPGPGTGTDTGLPIDTGLPGGTDLPGSGLAGVGGPGGGLSGIGGPGGGLGGGPGLSGAGLTGLGQGTSLPAGTVKGLGPITSPFGGAGMPGMPGAGAAGAGAGAGGRGGRGTSAGGRNSGLLGGTGAGAGRGGPGDEHATWLQEDEDVWGTDTGAAPPLLT